MAGNSVRDLTSGSPAKLLIAFTLPLLFGMLFQQFYNMVDTIVVGKFLGVQALAGVGSTGSISYLVMGLCTGICAGFAIPVALKFGQKDFDGLRKFVGNMIWLGAALAFGIMLVTTVFCGQILRWMDTPADTFSYAYDYIWVVFLGIPATMLYNLLSGIIRSLGDSRTPLYFLIFSSLLNIALDLVCILVLDMGVAGAGWATLTSQLVSGLLCLRYVIRNFPMLRLGRQDLRLERAYAGKLLAMGLPMGLQCSVNAIGSILLQTAVNSLGAAAMAGMAAASKVSLFLSTPFDAVGSACATYSSQNLGARRPDRVHQGTKAAAAMGLVYALSIWVLVYFLGGAMTSLFLDTRDAAAVAEIVPLSRQYLMSLVNFYIPLLFVYLLRYVVQGLGYSDLAVIAGFMEMVARSLVAVWFVPRFGFTAVCLAGPTAWVLADLFLFPCYFFCLKKRGYKASFL